MVGSASGAAIETDVDDCGDLQVGTDESDRTIRALARMLDAVRASSDHGSTIRNIVFTHHRGQLWL